MSRFPEYINRILYFCSYNLQNVSEIINFQSNNNEIEFHNYDRNYDKAKVLSECSYVGYGNSKRFENENLVGAIFEITGLKKQCYQKKKFKSHKCIKSKNWPWDCKAFN